MKIHNADEDLYNHKGLKPFDILNEKEITQVRIFGSWSYSRWMFMAYRLNRESWFNVLPQELVMFIAQICMEISK